MKRILAAIQILTFATQSLATGLAAKTPQARALIPAYTQSPVGYLPFTGSAGLIPSPYRPTYTQPTMQLNTGSFAYTPAMPGGGYNPYGAQYPGYPQMNQQLYPQMNGQMGAFGSAQPSSPTMNPQMLMAALSALPGIVYQMTKKSPTDEDSSYQRNRERERERERQRDRERDDDRRSSRDRSDKSRSSRRPIAPLRDSDEDIEQAQRTRAERTESPHSQIVEENRVRQQTETTRPAVQQPSVAAADARKAKPTWTKPEPVPATVLSRNEVQATLGRIDQVNQQQVNATNPAAGRVPEGPCPTCGQASARAEQCTTADGYFEQTLLKADDNGIKIAKGHAANPQTIKCVSEALKSVNSDRVQFVSCSKSGTELGEAVARPCASDDMVKTMAGAYEMVSDCLAGYVDPRADEASGKTIRAAIKKSMFQVWNYESGFAPNAAKKTANTRANGGGPGQLVQPLIQAINDKSGTEASRFEQMKKYISASKSPSCQELARFDFKPLRGDRANGCDRVALDNGNPMTNMMYSMAFLKMMRTSLYKTASSLDGLNPASRERLLDQLTIWGQGAGGEAIEKAFEKVMKARGATLVGQPSEQSYQQFLTAMKSEVKATLEALKKDRPTLKINADLDSNYLERTQAELSNLEKRVNGSCGQF